MKNNSHSIVRKLLTSVPLVALQKNAAGNRSLVRPATRNHPAEREQNLNRIFMVRYRTNHL